MKEMISKLGTELKEKNLEEGKKILENFFDENTEIDISEDCNEAYYHRVNGNSNEIRRSEAIKGDTVLMSNYYLTDITDDITVEYITEFEVIELNDSDEDDLKYIKEGWRVWGYESNKN